MSKTSTTYVGLDVHKETIVAAVLRPRRKTAEVTKLANDETAVRRFVRKLRKADAGRIVACYEAGPTGFALQRLLVGLDVHCQVIAPSLIPAKPGERVKTDRRDAVKLVELLRAELLNEVHPPTPEPEVPRPDIRDARSNPPAYPRAAPRPDPARPNAVDARPRNRRGTIARSGVPLHRTAASRRARWS